MKAITNPAPNTPTYRVVCPFCFAFIGIRCTTAEGSLREWAHRERVTAATAARGEPEVP